MSEHTWLAEQFEANRQGLQSVAYRMLGSLSEAEDAVQETWFRLSRSDTSAVENLGGWLTTVVARVCLDMLRRRAARREEPLNTDMLGSIASAGGNPEQEALLADSVGLALLVVLDRLTPAERLAFVLHDAFAVPFEQIAPVVGRSPDATRKLASRARRRVRGVATVPQGDLRQQHAVINAFLTASRTGNFEALLTLLDPNVVLHDDRTDAAQELRGAALVAQQVVGRAQAAHPALINGAVGVVVAPFGRLLMILRLTVHHQKIMAISLVSRPERLRALDIATLA